ncbi:MAG: DUF4340 domain-containing protein [Ancalomicrobiaceae bacterium]|nr:DUF4340 domain-containing protein [Ancalomicrobiaceae bacterium]
MQRKTLIGLGLATVVAVVAAVGVSVSDHAEGILADSGRTLFPDLKTDLGSIDHVVVTRGKGVTTVTRSGEHFVDASGYPVKPKAIADLVASLGTLVIDEKKTAEPVRYPELDLADPTAKSGAAVRVELKAGDRTVAGLYAGKQDDTVGSASGGQYVRRLDGPASYLVRGTVKLPNTRADWFETRLLGIDAKTLAAATFTPRTGEAVDLVKAGDGLALATTPDGRKPDTTKLDRLAHVASALDFEDVRAGKGAAPPGGAAFRLTTGAGLVVTIAEDGPSADRWVRISAEAAKDTAHADADAINAKAKGFAFRLSSHDAEPFAWKAEDLLAKPQS